MSDIAAEEKKVLQNRALDIIQVVFLQGVATPTTSTCLLAGKVGLKCDATCKGSKKYPRIISFVFIMRIILHKLTPNILHGQKKSLKAIPRGHLKSLLLLL